MTFREASREGMCNMRKCDFVPPMIHYVRQGLSSVHLLRHLSFKAPKLSLPSQGEKPSKDISELFTILDFKDPIGAVLLAWLLARAFEVPNAENLRGTQGNVPQNRAVLEGREKL